MEFIIYFNQSKQIIHFLSGFFLHRWKNMAVCI